MAFHVGQKVVCVYDEGNCYLTRGKVYTVSGTGPVPGPRQTPGVFLVETAHDPSFTPFYVSRFRPLIERKSSTQTGFEILDEIRKRETIDAPVSDHQRERRTEPQRPAQRVVP